MRRNLLSLCLLLVGIFSFLQLYIFSNLPSNRQHAQLKHAHDYQQPYSFFNDQMVLFENLDSFEYFAETVLEYKQRIRKSIEALDIKYPEDIFVSVPSYRDPFCSDTLRNMFDNAKNPQRVFVGLCDQVHPNDIEELCIPPRGLENQVRTVRIDYKQSRGPTFARYIASKLWNGEKYFLKIDAHSHFLKDWDQILVDMIRKFPKKTILTHYPVAEDLLLGDNQINHFPWMCKAVFRPDAYDGLLIQSCEECHSINHPDSVSCPTPFVAAGFLFGSSKMIYDVPYDRHLPWLFEGEELLLAARLWTSGWNFFSPLTNIISHQYGYRNHSIREEVKGSTSDANTMSRVRYLLGQFLPEGENWKKASFPTNNSEEITELGLGSDRTLEEYLQFAQIDWIKRENIYICFSKYDSVQKKWIQVR